LRYEYKGEVRLIDDYQVVDADLEIGNYQIKTYPFVSEAAKPFDLILSMDFLEKNHILTGYWEKILFCRLHNPPIYLGFRRRGIERYNSSLSYHLQIQS
jgi:hypothetical protein